MVDGLSTFTWHDDSGNPGDTAGALVACARAAAECDGVRAKTRGRARGSQVGSVAKRDGVRARLVAKCDGVLAKPAA